MRDKIPLLRLALCVLPSLSMTGACLADATALLEQAQTHVTDGAYEQAEAIYQQVIADYPGTDYPFQAQKGLAILYIAWGKQHEADKAFDELRANYSSHLDFPGAVCLIGDNYRWRGADEKARQMYEISLEGASASEAFWPEMGLAITSVRLKDYETGDPLTVQILVDFADDDRLPIAACRIADAYRSVRHHRQATDLYRYVVENHSDSEYAMWSQMGIAISNIDLGNHDAAESAVEELHTNHADHPSFYKAVGDIGDNYRWRNIHDKAREMYQLAIEGISPSDAFWVKAGLAITSIRLKDYETGGQLTEQIQTEFSDHNQLPEALRLIADAYRSTRHHRQAMDLYEYVIQSHGDSKHAMWSQTGIAICNIDLGKSDAAELAIQKLRANYADHPSFDKALSDIGDNYRWRDLHDRAREMYQLAVVGLSPSEAFWPKVGIAIASVHLRDYTAAEQLTAEIQAEFAEREQLPEAICLIADAYRSVRGYEKALGLYQHILEAWPRNEQALWTRAAMARIAVALGDEAAAAEAIDSMNSDFPNHPALPAALWAVEEEYYDLAFQYKNEGLDARADEYFAKVISTGQEILEQWPESAPSGEICHISAICYERLEERTKAIEYFRKVVDDWPEYEYAWSAQFLIGHNYEQLMDPNELPEPPIVAEIKIAFEQLLQKYPDCPVAGGARGWLETHSRLIRALEGGQK